ncbi:hypothetical protein [Catenibacterium sp.]|uniref:hypothetical protein n=1 Tax=Catenibacterium sp. TaxID=2049022 RepID=UPI002E7A0CF9|nr:hypothetical protein [Catenibacterium sp.]MEE0040961.1 hypothetical protein [Catenibacterium sp.]
MTARQVWEGMLTELSKVNAPSMLLQDFNYFFNKAISQYINKRYNIYDINQQTSDDLRVLKTTAILKPTQSEPLKALSNLGAGKSKLFGATYEVILPPDYLHILNCICIYKVNKKWKCYDAGDYVQFAAKRLTADSWSVIVNDYYNRPLPERPYFYIHNININNTLPTNPITDTNPNGTDLSTEYVGFKEIQYYLISDKVINSTVVVKAGTRVYVKDGDVYKENTYTTKIEGATMNDLSTKTVVVSPTEIQYYLISSKDGVAAGTRVYVKDEIVYKEDTYTTEIEGATMNDLSTKTVEGKTIKSNFPRTIKLGKPDYRTVSTVDRDAGTRYGNASNVRMEIRYGHDDSVFKLEKVFIDYIKSPQTIRLT